MHILPAHLWNPDPISAGVRATVISGGTALDGDETVIQTDGGGRIEIIYGEFDLDEELPRRVYGVWQDELAGGAKIVLVPVIKIEHAPVPDGATDRPFVTNNDYFPTEAGFSPPYVIASTAEAAALRDTTITIVVTQGAALQGDTWFGFSNRAHKIKRIISVTANEYLVEFSPPLRHAVAAGTPVNFDWPVVQCRAVLGQDLIPAISLGKYGSMALSFVEDFSEPEA